MTNAIPLICKYVLAWKRGIAVLTAGNVKVSPDARLELIDGYNLQIRNLQVQDAGDYVCQIGTLEPKEITHTLEILVAPRLSTDVSHAINHFGVKLCDVKQLALLSKHRHFYVTVVLRARGLKLPETGHGTTYYQSDTSRPASPELSVFITIPQENSQW
uniref:Ig-like domain-containing protein n=1 Tax=Timema monikensis TaxID=170555 RepID=A0A7R9DYT7_9NEOP|nr:unnamed protein product [Timema monikensis]